jgi:hypothetical protein
MTNSVNRPVPTVQRDPSQRRPASRFPCSSQVLALAADPVVVRVEVMRIGWQSREVVHADIAAVEVRWGGGMQKSG